MILRAQLGLHWLAIELNEGGIVVRVHCWKEILRRRDKVRISDVKIISVFVKLLWSHVSDLGDGHCTEVLRVVGNKSKGCKAQL
jgi:hypothetical protein